MDKYTLNEQNVVVMSDYQPETGYAAIAQVEAYWEAIRGARLLPKRSDIDPRGIEQALENAFILERVAPGIARLRIAGNHLHDIIGMETRGMPLTTFFSPAARSVVADMLEVVFQTPAIGTLRLASPAGPERGALEGRMVLLPLKSDLGDVSRVLGCLVTKGDIGLSPRRFDITAQEVLQIAPGQPPLPAPLTRQDARQPTVQGEPALPARRGMQEEQSPFAARGAKKRPPYLRLVKSED
ncbi:PAS domain-containing protein [Marimonas sp. MJW-29]|uniref:PAS domain-containing protein n=1 Tax=Sulfitobacter sediminis TaxID=3234186 RepID=A0ABV3RSL5_9RHOB